MRNRTYIELVLELFAFISFHMAMLATGTALLVLSIITIALTVWMPFVRGRMNRFTRAVSIALPIAAAVRVVVHFLPNASL
ncbi:MAG: hypothetical protein ACREPD_14835 [Stenotrophomonas sp.]|uniref:hypothetical protein n=1 Tax=Stenotrophomonas sp. TaxID=69392 RepID=UPI003D6D68AF